MRCPSCGFPVDQQGLAQCPQCGRPLLASEEQPIAGSASFADPSIPPPGAEPVVPNVQAPPPNPFSPYTPYTPPGQPGPYPPMPNGPAAPGYPPAGYAQPLYAPAPPIAPAPPSPPKSRTGLIVGIVAAVVVLLVACTGGVLLAIRAQHPTSAATAGPAATPTLYASKVYSNTFSSSADDWTEDPQHCYLANDGYHAAGGYYCTVPIVEQDNVDISVKVQQVSGPMDWSYGLLFRQQDKDDYYAFMINSSREWVFVRCVAADCTTPIYFTENDAIRPGLGVNNTIEVRAVGSHFVFFVNGTQVGTYDDTALTFGKLSLIATGASIDCAFTNLVITRPD